MDKHNFLHPFSFQFCSSRTEAELPSKNCRGSSQWRLQTGSLGAWFSFWIIALPPSGPREDLHPPLAGGATGVIFQMMAPPNPQPRCYPGGPALRWCRRLCCNLLFIPWERGYNGASEENSLQSPEWEQRETCVAQTSAPGCVFLTHLPARPSSRFSPLERECY